MAKPSQPDFQKKSSPAPGTTPSQAMAPRPFAPQVDVAAPDVQAPDVAAPDAPALDNGPAFPKLNFQIRAAGGSPPPLQPKLTIGAPNDKYEQEADRVAAQVVQRIHAPAANLPTENRTYQAQSVQRQAGPEQPVLKMKSTLQRETLPDDEDELQMKPMIQRIEISEDDGLQMKPRPQRSEMPPGVKLQMKSASSEGVVEGDASPDLEAGIQRARGNGQALAPTLQMHMGQAMGIDFSGVRVHTDTQSDQLNRSIQAKAFTTGQDIFFRGGAYNPGSRDGQELIAHELTHVVQQGGTQPDTTAPGRRPLTTKAEAGRIQRVSNVAESGTPSNGRAHVSTLNFTCDGRIYGDSANGTDEVAARLRSRGMMRQDIKFKHPDREPFAMHLCNAKLGGKGDKRYNLAWGSHKHNVKHYKEWEQYVQDFAAERANIGWSVRMEVTATYESDDAKTSMGHMLKSLRCEWTKIPPANSGAMEEEMPAVEVSGNVAEEIDSEYVDTDDYDSDEEDKEWKKQQKSRTSIKQKSKIDARIAGKDNRKDALKSGGKRKRDQQTMKARTRNF